MCSFGTSPSALMVTPESKVLFESKPVATVPDAIPMKNILPFGMCTTLTNPIVATQTAAALGILTPTACMPVIVGTWVPPVPTVFIAGKPVIDQTAKCVCAWGGIVQITNPGATKEQIP